MIKDVTLNMARLLKKLEYEQSYNLYFEICIQLLVKRETV